MMAKNKSENKSPYARQSLEECGFVTHLLFIAFGCVYVYCLCSETGTRIMINDHGKNDSSFHLSEEQQQAAKQVCRSLDKWSILVPAFLVIAFWTTPVIYFLLNSASACTATDPLSLVWPSSSSIRQGSNQFREESSDLSFQVPHINAIEIAEVNNLFDK